jgi:Zn-dependent protease with chaperone function
MTIGAQDPQVIARLQAEATARPRAYRLRLVVIAIAGDLALTTTQVLPWAAPTVIGAFLINLKLFYWLGAAAIVFFAWVFRPTFRFQGRTLTIEEAPRLYEEMHRLRKLLRVPTRMDVYVDNSLNASAAETRGLFGVLGTRCALTLGLPLLVALTREQALAVIAHEFGHFSRRHGRLGHWLYRARVGWMQYAEYVEESDSSFDKAAAWYARRFVPYFSARSFVHSRQCEYEADADAALAVGADTFAAALTRLEVIGRLWEDKLPPALARWQSENLDPPHDFLARFERLTTECSVNDLRSWLDDALRAPSNWHDTHPSLAERLRSLQRAPVLASAEGNAAEVLLGEQWPKLAAELNAKWMTEVRGEWMVEHLRMRHLVRPLLSADEVSVRTWDAERRLARAEALCRSAPAIGFRELEELYQSDPSDRRITFAYAAALLRNNDPCGVKLMETLARDVPALRPAAFRRVLAFFEKAGDSVQIERWSAWLKKVHQGLGDAVSLFVAQAEAGASRPTSLPAESKAVITDMARSEPCIGKAWLREGTAQFAYASDRSAVPVTVHLLVLAIDLAEAKRLNEDEERIAGRYQRLLRTLIPPDETSVVRTYFTTEYIPIAYRTQPALAGDTGEGQRRVVLAKQLSDG